MGRRLWDLTAAGGVLGLMMLAACLVTDKVDFESPNVPAQVKLEAPRGSIVDLRPEGESECQADDFSDGMRFDVQVSDPNVEDELVLLFVKNHQKLNNVVGTGPVPVNGQVERELRQLCVPRAELAKEPCSYVEIIVSRDFEGLEPYGTKDPDDLGVAHILVNGDVTARPESPKSDCYTDAGAP